MYVYTYPSEKQIKQNMGKLLIHQYSSQIQFSYKIPKFKIIL